MNMTIVIMFLQNLNAPTSKSVPLDSPAIEISVVRGPTGSKGVR
jgi:hypothetical protein